MKKIEEMSDYEILDIGPEADPTEIYMAYIQVKDSLDQSSMAHYTLISDEEKEQLRNRAELAYQNLIDKKKREGYDIKLQEDPKNQFPPSIIYHGITHAQYKEGENGLSPGKLKANDIIDQPPPIEISSQSSPMMRSLKRNFFSPSEKWIFTILFFIFILVLFGVIISFIPE